MRERSLLWNAFHDDKTLYKNDKHHFNAWCLACLDPIIASAQEAETLAIANGAAPAQARTTKEWRIHASTKLEPICGKLDGMRRHLMKCNIIEGSPQRKQQRDALLVRVDTAKTSTSRSQSVASSSNYSMLPPPPPSYHPFSQHSPSPQPESYHSPSPSAPPLSPLLPFEGISTLPFGSPFSPADEPQSSLFDTPLKRRRTSTSSHAPAWSGDEQQEFHDDLCNLFVTCAWSWNAVNNPEFKMFFAKYLPQANLPDRRVLSGTVLDRQAAKVVARTRQETNGKLATYSEDGWTNISRTHVDTSVISVEETSHLLKTHDMTGRPKTGDELFKVVQSDVKYAEETYGVEVIAICTDDGPDGKKMRPLTKELTPWIAAFECWGHQSHLITGNYLTIKAPWMDSAKQATEVVKFFNHHQTPLDLLRAQELTTRGRYLALILPVLTRWLSQYCAIRRLTKLRKEVRLVVIAHEDTLRTCLGRKQEQIAVAERMIKICQDEEFWTNLARIGNHLEPLAIASNILQAPYCRLDMVLLTLGNLFRIFGDLPDHDLHVKETLHASLERRWAKTDQELMILGVFFNPFVRTRPFNSESLPPITFFHLVRRAFKRLLRQDAAGDAEFLAAFNSYYDNTGFFSDESMWIEGHRQLYEQNGKHIDLVAIWRRMDNSKSLRGRGGFVSLVVRILSILPNSAGPERVFSDFGMIHTKRRNRLHPTKVHNTSLVRADRLRAHAAAGLIPKRKLRRCSLAEDLAENAALDEEPEVGTSLDDAHSEDSIGNDFEAMAGVLIDLAAQESQDMEDDEDELEPPVPTPRPSASSSVIDPHLRIPKYTKITLEKLFRYPARGSPASDLDFFWRVGRAGVDAEEEEMVSEQAGVPVETGVDTANGTV